MKKLMTALILAILIAGQMFSLAAAQPLQAPPDEVCGVTYTVKPGDNLFKIAAFCGIPVDRILRLNPDISLADPIFPDQVLRLTDTAPIKYSPTLVGHITVDGNIRMSISDIRVREGENISVYVSGFPANSQITFYLGRYGQTYSTAYDGRVDSEGEASMTVSIPGDAVVGEYWVVRAQTTINSKTTRIASKPILITGQLYDETPGGNARVTLDEWIIPPGGTVIVTVTGFPPLADIDYRVAEYGLSYTAIYDGETDEEGKAERMITLSTAEAGEIWIIHVQTTSHVVGVDRNSPRIRVITWEEYNALRASR